MAEQPEKTMRDYLNPEKNAQTSCIVFPEMLPANTFSVKPNHISLLPYFHGRDQESAYAHMRDFDEIVGTIVSHDGQKESARLKLFPFSLKDKAKSWFNTIAPQSIANWKELQQLFYKKFCPIHRTRKLMFSIQTFKEKGG